MTSVNEHSSILSNACVNIGAHDNNHSMRLFVNSLEGRVVVEFFNLIEKIISTWFEML